MCRLCHTQRHQLVTAVHVEPSAGTFRRELRNSVLVPRVLLRGCCARERQRGDDHQPDNLKVSDPILGSWSLT